MTWEDKKYRSDLSAAKRNYPLNYDEMFSMAKPLFPIPALNECYQRYIQEHGAQRSSVNHFFYYLLNQVKPEEKIAPEFNDNKPQGEMSDKELIEYLKGELKRVKEQRNEYQRQLGDMTDKYNMAATDLNRLESYINRVQE